MMSTIDVSSILCEEILSSKIFFPKLLVMARDIVDSSLDQEMPNLSNEDSPKCVMIMEESSGKEAPCSDTRIFEIPRCADRVTPEPSTNSNTSSLYLSPSSMGTASLLSEDFENSASCSDGDPDQEVDPVASSSRRNSFIEPPNILPCNSQDYQFSSQVSNETGIHKSEEEIALPDNPSELITSHLVAFEHHSKTFAATQSPKTDCKSEIPKKMSVVMNASPMKEKIDSKKDDRKINEISQEISKCKSLPQLNKSIVPLMSQTVQRKAHEDKVKIKDRSRSVGSSSSVRVRKLSEKGMIEQIFPVFDPLMKDIWDFNNFSPVKHVKRATGIRNTTQHCFMISVMQTLVHTAPFVRFIMEKHNHNNGVPVERCFCCDLKQHVHRVLRIRNIPHRMDWILVHWKKLFGAEYFTTQEDAHEFLLKVLELIDRCCCPPTSSIDAIPKEPSPPMVQLFGFKLRYQMVCSTCGTCSVSYALHNDLSLHLPRQDYVRFPPNMHQLIAIYMKDEVLEYACPNKKCHGKYARRTPFIFRSPSVLILQVKRFLHNGRKNGMKVNVEEHLSLDQFTYSQGGNENYELTAVISHQGNRQYTGHYTALVRGYDRKFYHFNDEFVNEQRLLTADLCPYLVVYSRRGPQDRIFASPTKSNVCLPVQKAPSLTPNSAKEQLARKVNVDAVPPVSNPAVIHPATKVAVPRKLETYFKKINVAESQWKTEIGQQNSRSIQADGYAGLGRNIMSAIGSEDEKNWTNGKENGSVTSFQGFGVSKMRQTNYIEARFNGSRSFGSSDTDTLLQAIESITANMSKRRIGSTMKSGHQQNHYSFCKSSPNEDDARKKPRLG
ncbi:hypothetical protein RB195_021181 [Necator americanus]|uniref:Ubiquitin carboxyl-terminal hydrolase 36 n=1 Tax=Necator americanus TaxID=51031 RepID=A0ABR1EAE4_NECAM